MATLVERFEQTTIEGCRRLSREHGYNPTYFLRMVSEMGALEATRALLRSQHAQAGLTRLWELGLLDWSVEAAVVSREYGALFSPEEQRIARQRLQALGWSPSDSRLELRPRRDLLRALRTTQEGAAAAGWDGFGAAPVSAETLSAARRVALSLPTDLPDPTPGAEPDGHLTLEWYLSPRRVVSVSVAPGGDLHWAALLDEESATGSSRFTGTVPAELVDLVRRVLAQ
jgi:hypothetical protein